ncbi:Abi family protein [Corynebacterium mustelae]|nr:Abi family protein [Corynebacterium mustelae]
MGMFSFYRSQVLTPMRYQKPHLSYDDQLKLLRAQGVIIDNWDESLSALRYYGYYRLSGYFYPFRQILPKEERQSPTNFRKEDFNPETHFNYAINLANFDSRLRKILFEDLEMAEIAIRTKIVYEAGKVDPYIHVNQDLLDIEACARLISTNPEAH